MNRKHIHIAISSAALVASIHAAASFSIIVDFIVHSGPHIVNATMGFTR